jgi:hypothetical protein
VHAEVERRGRRVRVVGRMDPANPGTPWADPVSGAACVPKPGWVARAGAPGVL